MIQLNNIRKSFKVVQRKKGAFSALKSLFYREYKTINALDDISFFVNKGEIAGFIGPNGAGKSTAIKIMSGILVPDSGECTVMGICPWKMRKKYVSKIGVVFGQRTQLWWDIPVQDSYDLLRNIYNVEENIFKKNMEELTEILELEDLLSIPLRQLSLGQRIRCELMASLLHNPDVLFLDEPTIGLDAVSKLAVRRIILDLNKRNDITVILSSHDMDDIEALTNRIILIGKGKILHDGELSALRMRYDRIRKLEISYGEIEGEKSKLPVPQGTELLSVKDNRAVYQVDTEIMGVSSVLSILGESLDIKDMSATSRPIEEIIASIYKDGNL